MIGRDQKTFDETTTTVSTMQNYKAIKTIGFVLGVFIVSWMPCLVVSVVYHFAANNECADEKLYSLV